MEKNEKTPKSKKTSKTILKLHYINLGVEKNLKQVKEFALIAYKTPKEYAISQYCNEAQLITEKGKLNLSIGISNSPLILPSQTESQT